MEKELKNFIPIFIKSEPDREYTHHIHSDNDLPRIPKDCFTQEREITIASYSETISSESSSEERTLTAETEHATSSMEDQIEDGSYIKENDITENNNSSTKENHATEIESALHQITTSLHHAANRYLALASTIPKMEPYELPQVIAQVPPPPIDVPILIRKALSIDCEEKVINHILQGEYELSNTSWSKLQNKYNLTEGRVYKALKGKRRPGALQYRQKRRYAKKLDTTTLCTNSETK